MKLLIILICTISFTGIVNAQKRNLEGQLVDTLKNPLEGATVMLLNPVDSSLVSFTLTDPHGKFRFNNLRTGSYLLKVTFLGFQPISYPFELNGDPAVNLPTLTMLPASNELQTIEIEGYRDPVKIRHDTIEFNAGSFKTQPNAVVEDLLKKLPGVEVSADGKITAQGEEVNRVTVDGKNFFGSDPKLATKNLPADAIDKVQVFDKKSDQASFSGIDDGQREKTINLQLKEEKRRGAFGNILAGGGFDERFHAKTSINKFSKTRQLSLLAMANNTNDPGFGMEEYLNFSGGSQRMMSGGQVRLEIGGDNESGVPMNFGNRTNGLMSSFAGGINLNNSFPKNTEANGSFFSNYINHNKDESTIRENFLPKGTFTFNQSARQENENFNHRFNSSIEHKLDSSNHLKLTLSGTYNMTETDSEVRSETQADSGKKLNQGERFASSSVAATILNASVLWRHKFSKKGRTFSWKISTVDNQSEGNQYQQSTNTFYTSFDSSVTLNQSTTQDTRLFRYETSFSYTEPLGKRRYLEANYSYNGTVNDSERRVVDIIDSEQLLNENFSNDFSSAFSYHRGGLNFRWVRKNFNLIFGTAFQESSLKGEVFKIDSKIGKGYQNILPTARMAFDLSGTKHFQVDYETSIQPPTIQQLQPVIDNSDPLNLYVGNPSLRPSDNHSFRSNFRSFDPLSLISFFAFADFDYTQNAIVEAQYINENLIRTTQPVNVAATKNLRSTANFSVPINKLASRVSLTANFAWQNSMTMLNDQVNKIQGTTTGGRLGYLFNISDLLDFVSSVDISQQKTNFEFDTPDQKFINRTYSAEANLRFLKTFSTSLSLEYLDYKNYQDGFRQSIPIVDFSLSKFVLKNNAGQVKFSINNMLNKNMGVSQTTGINYLERKVMNSLGQVVMLTFYYSLNKHLNPMRMQRPGMMKIIR